MCVKFLLAYLILAALTPPARAADLSKYDPSCGIRITEQDNNELKVEWSAGTMKQAMTLNLNPGAPLLTAVQSSSADHPPKVVATDLNPRFVITIGSRVSNTPGYVFFDNPRRRPSTKHDSTLAPKDVRVTSTGRRATIAIGGLSAGPFSGDLLMHLYDGSPFVHFQAAMTHNEPGRAYIYDAYLDGRLQHVSYETVEGKLENRAVSDKVENLAVRYRTIMSSSWGGGTVALFPTPHAFFFPRDYSNNLKFTQASSKHFGIRQDATGGGAFVPWFDTHPGKVQRMDFFLLFAKADPHETLEKIKKYTRSDRFKEIPGRLTFTSHYHSRLSVAEMRDKHHVVPEFVKVMKDMGVNIVHLSEFHGDGNFNDPGPKRLPEMWMMFDICRRFSDDKLLLLPGEEGSKYLGNAKGRDHPGHWSYFFPKNVYFTWNRKEGQPFVEEIPPYGTVYHVGSKDDMVELLKREKGLAWTAHPRIKASIKAPDAFKDEPWYKDPLWLGAAYKAMPGDLSDDRLGIRCLDLLDDMNNWSQRKYLPGEVDVFEIDRTHELYAHMNINYMRLDKLPRPDDWTPVLDCLRRGDFFVTTGEILIHDFTVKDGKATADLEWTYPLAFAEVIWGTGADTKRHRIALSDTTEHQRKTFEWPIDPKGAKWLRFEVWDIARNGAFTQPQDP